MASVWQELKRRNVVKVAVAYAIVGWLLIEASSVLLPAFDAPDWILRVVILLVGIGWFFRNDLGKRGIFASLVVGQICFVAIFCKGGSTEFLIKSVLLLVAPLGLFLLVKTQDTLRKKRYIVALLLIMR